MKNLIGYINRPSPVHSLTGAAKLICMLLWSFAVMLTYDTRVLIVLLILGLAVFAVSKIRVSDVSIVLAFMLVFLVINNIALYFFSPEEGVRIYGTRHELCHLFAWYYLTAEQLFYMFNVSLKYFTIIPMALIFIVTTDPSEFASSLNRIGVSYRVSYAVAIAFRYIPDIQRDYHDIAQAQQARGIDISSKEKLMRRIKNAAAILVPLIMQSLSRIEVISNAMELRGFGKKKARTWYAARPFRVRDYAAMAFCILITIASLVITFYDGDRFYNPFAYEHQPSFSAIVYIRS